jgi:hypothetical protein
LRTDVLDRDAALAGASDANTAPEGAPLDLLALPAGFRLDIDSADEVGSLQDELPPTRSATWNNALQGIALAAAADVVTAVVVAPPAVAIGITAKGVVVQAAPNVWVATNAVSDGVRTVSGTFTVAWVGTGWLCAMRLSSDDGAYANTRWFDGYLQADGTIGWWDLYDGAGTLVGVVEWSDDGVGDAEFGIAALTGDAAGDVLLYTNAGDDAAVSYWDAGRQESTWVDVAGDGSGDVRSPDHNAGIQGCWAPADATDPYADVACQ